MRSIAWPSPPAVYETLAQRGVSDDALRLRQGWETLYQTFVNSVALGSQYHRLRLDLDAIAVEAGTSGWDGYGAKAISPDALSFARRLARMLPATPLAPDVSVDPDGEVSFDWDAGSRRRFSLSVNPSGAMRYASITGSSENFGLEPWRDGIPEAIVRGLQKLAAG